MSRWMKRMGYKYDKNKHSYYTDGHERKDVVDDRNGRFLGKYYDYELSTHRWIQVTEETSNKLETLHNDFPKNCYHSYKNNNINMREYHIDTHPILQNYITPVMQTYGGNLSVRKETGQRQIMLIGQDESTYHQYVFSSKQWKGPSGRSFIQPKGDGEILMLSGFQSREFGLGLRTLLTEDVLSAVNGLRKGTKYKSEESAMLVHNTV